MKINFESALEIIKDKIHSHKSEAPLVIAIDGKSASGKTTFAGLLGVTVIHTDDFYRPRNSFGELEVSEYSGNFDIKRFKCEVVSNLKSQKNFKYGVFNCKKGCITEYVNVLCSNCIVVEGAYSTHPELGDYADIKMFFDIHDAIQRQRIIARNGEGAYKTFSDIWIPAENAYFSHYLIKENSHITVADSGFDGSAK